jgi:hypothetical protein
MIGGLQELHGRGIMGGKHKPTGGYAQHSKDNAGQDFFAHILLLSL